VCSSDLTENANSTSTEAMIDSKLGFTTPDKCKSYALDNNYKFYAMQAKQSNGTSTCLVSNDKTQVISYGQSKNPITMIPLWSSNTPNTNYVSASISQTGQLTLTDANGNTKTLNDAVTQCNGSPCSFYLLLQKDGNMCLYNGKPGDRSTVIFSTKTAGSQKNQNNDWVASKGEYGNAYLNLGQTLSTNQWIGSDDGALKLIMQSDGNLVLYTSSVKNGCSVSNGNNYGNANINAVYQIDSTGFPNNLGNIGYVDKDAVLHPYPSTMIGYSSTYNVYDNFDSQGNDISQTQTNDINGCEQACNANDQCAGFVFEKGSNICYLKNSGMYPKSPRQPNTKLTMAVRKPTIINSDSKPNSIPMPIEIDSIRYENYQKGDNMTTTTKYNEPVINENIKNQMTLIQNKLTSVASHIADKMEAMYTQDKQILSKMNMNDEEFKQKILMYKRVSMDQNNLNGIRSKTDTNNKKEGMQNLNINDINGMLMDSDTHILQENYGYIFWSILAVGLLTVTINVMKKDM